MICQRCILDDTVSDIRFDANKICNYCTDYLAKKDSILKGPEELKKVVTNLKNSKSRYACIVGVSGGLDSSYLLHQAVRLGLKTLAVHIDTGWNTEISAYNVEKITKSLQVDLKTFVLDWEQFKNLQVSYLRAGVIDIEFPTDHYYLSALYKIAADLGIKYILTGNNYISEGIMPDCWIHNKGDTLNMLDIHRKFGNKSAIDKLPTLTLAKRFYYYNIKRMENIFLLNYLNYNRQEAKEYLINKYSWREYPVKHGESVFTRFYQRYILPRRFNIDYRKAHLSSLICNGQITRDEALKSLESKIVDNDLIQNDKVYVLKKLNLTEEEFERHMHSIPRSHQEFKSEIKIKKIYNFLVQLSMLGYFFKISNRH